MNVPARQVVETSGGHIAYREVGDGPSTVVLIHGTLVTADDMMIALADHLSPRFRVVAMDRPGHGGSDAQARDQGSPWSQAARILEACRALNLRDPFLIGHSFGGAVALAAAMADPDAVAGVVALAPICFPEPRLEQVLFGPRAVPVAGPLLARTLGAATDQAMLPLLRNLMFFPQAMPSAYAETFPFSWASRPGQMVADGKDSMALWAGLMVGAWASGRRHGPVTILGGTHDLIINNAAHGLMTAASIPGATFRWVSGAGHMLHHFHQDLVVDALGEASAKAASA